MLWLVFHNDNKIIYIFVGKDQKQIEFGTSCSSLKKAGIFISGFYNIKSKDTEKQQVVFCDMETMRMLRAVEAERIEKMKVAVKREEVFCWPPFIPMAPVVTKSAVT